MIVFALCTSVSFSSCSDDEGENGGGNGNGGSNNTTLVVTVNEDGTVSGGHTFSAIDDKTFYIDYVKYSVVEGHLEVTGYDKSALPSEIKIISSLNYKGNSYKVLSIGECAFAGRNITSVVIANSVTTIKWRAFNDCESLVSITLPNSVTTIEEDAFSCCESLSSVVIPNSVTYIGEYAFNKCPLTSVNIPSSVTFLSGRAFSSCTSLQNINVDKSNKNYSSIDGVLLNKDATELLICPGGKKGEYTIPNSVKTITDGAFLCCESLTFINIPNSVTTIGESAFWDCESLTSINIPNSVTSIAQAAFSGCSSLTSINIPNSVTSIAPQTFEFCESLTSINIPNSVNSIEYLAFRKCTSLSSINIPNSVTSIGENAFYACPLIDIYCLNPIPPVCHWDAFSSDDFFDTFEKCTLHVPVGSKDKYANAYRWSSFQNIVEDVTK